MFYQASLNTIRGAVIEATAAYLGVGTTHSLSVPDFSNMAGWQALYGLQATSAITWSVRGSDRGGPPNGFSPPPSDGLIWKAGERTGRTTP